MAYRYFWASLSAHHAPGNHVPATGNPDAWLGYAIFIVIALILLVILASVAGIIIIVFRLLGPAITVGSLSALIASLVTHNTELTIGGIIGMASGLLVWRVIGRWLG